MEAYENAAYEFLTKPLSLSESEELMWFFGSPGPNWTLRPQIEPGCRQLEERFAARDSRLSAGTGARKEIVRSFWPPRPSLATYWSVSERMSNALNCRTATSISLLLPCRKGQNRGMKLSG